jgi:hypothetical protein
MSPQENNRSVGILLFPEKEAKSVSSASQKIIGYATYGETDPLGVGSTPKGSIEKILPSSFHKKSKNHCSALQKAIAPQTSAKPTLGVWRLAPKKTTTLLLSFFFQNQ